MKSTRGEYLSNIRKVAHILKTTYRDFPHFNRKNPLDELLFILMSVMTREESYRRVYRGFRQAFPKIWMLHAASFEDIARTIERGGLVNRRSRIIKEIVESLVEKFGRPTLAPLTGMTDMEAEQFLMSLPGVGKKVARCVLMYSLDRAVFPVDTHCWRIAGRLGWVDWRSPQGGPTNEDMDRLQGYLPPALRYSLHVNMVSLGRRTCVAPIPKCGECPLKNLCPKIGVKENIQQ